MSIMSCLYDVYMFNYSRVGSGSLTLRQLIAADIGATLMYMWNDC